MKVIVTGATGMVGEGVLHECLQHREVEQVLVLTRRPTGMQHPKMTELIHSNFFDVTDIQDQLSGYDACFFCLGVSSVGMKEKEYTEKTYTLTMHIAETLAKQNPAMTFCYISGASTDSTEKGHSMWARVKGKTENDLQKLGFGKVYNFRPAIISPTKGLKNTLGFYKWLGWLIPLIKAITPNYITSLKNLGIAMINAVSKGFNKTILEVQDINALANA